MRRIFTKIMTFMLFWYLFDRISGGPICLGTIFGVCAYNKCWQHFLDQQCMFLPSVFANLCQNILYRKGPHPFGPVATQYYELRVETIRIGQPAIPALQCIKNQLPTRSGSAYKSTSLQDILKQFSGPRKVLKT